MIPLALSEFQQAMGNAERCRKWPIYTGVRMLEDTLNAPFCATLRQSFPGEHMVCKLNGHNQ